MIEPNLKRIECLLRAMDAREYELRRAEPRADLLESATSILLDEALGDRLRDHTGQDYVPRLRVLECLAEKYDYPRLARAVLELTRQPWRVRTRTLAFEGGVIRLPGSGARTIVPGR